MENFLPKMPDGDYDKENVMKQAQHIWTMLDEMNASNPDAYKKFIDKQMTDGKKAMVPPSPHMCVRTYMTKPKSSVFYINFLSWNTVPEPKTAEDPVPVTGTPVQEGKDEAGEFSMASCAFSPKILEEYGIDTRSPADRDTLINLAIDFIHNTHKIQLSRNFQLLPRETTHKGELENISKSFMQRSGQTKDQIDDHLAEFEKSFGPLPFGAKDTLMNKLSKITTEPNDSHVKSPKNDSQSKITIPGTDNSNVNNSKSKLIQEIPTDNWMNSLPTPKYTIDCTRNDEKHIETVQVNVQLPGVKSVADCELDISQDDLQLHVSGLFDLHLTFPCKIDDGSSKAKFNKKTSSLSLTLPADGVS